MSGEKRLKINEIFCSLQGEGFHTGVPSIFIRFSGCNLACEFCDTIHQNGAMMTAQEIISEVKKYSGNAQLIVLTGGEPSLFIDESFVSALKEETGLPIAIETNGTHQLPKNLDWVTFSPKHIFAGGDKHQPVLKECDELKVVYTGQDLSQYMSIKAKHYYLQPCYTSDVETTKNNVKATIDAVMRHRPWRLSIQTHKMLDIR